MNCVSFANILPNQIIFFLKSSSFTTATKSCITRRLFVAGRLSAGDYKLQALRQKGLAIYARLASTADGLRGLPCHKEALWQHVSNNKNVDRIPLLVHLDVKINNCSILFDKTMIF